MDVKEEKYSADDPVVPGLTRKELFHLLRHKLNVGAAPVYEEIEKAMSEKLQRPFTLSDDMKPTVRKLLSQFNAKWQVVSRYEAKFLQKFSNWLSVFILLERDPKASKSSSTGQPSLEFSEPSERTKRRRTEKLRAGTSSEELSYATQLSLQASAQLDAANVVQDVTVGSVSRAEQYRGSISSISQTPLSPDAALAIIVEANLSKSQYQIIRDASRANHSNLFPSYNKVHKSKLNCYPTNIIVTECSAEVKLQALLDHTIERILLTQTDVIGSLPREKVRNLDLICKWGCDGPFGQSTIKQEFPDDGSKSDANIFFTSLVPLQLLSVDPESQNTFIVWRNPRPSSPRFCRPIRIQFLHENTGATLNAMQFIKQQESSLVPFETVVNAKVISVSMKLTMNMIDGNVCNAITETASPQRCYLCGATSEDFNNIDAMLMREIKRDHLEFGLSTLHAWIRFFECCLHVGYKLGIKKSQALASSDEESVDRRKEVIQKGFRLRLGLIVDQPKPGFGSSNDGNTARRFFENPSISASITGVNEDLIKRFHIILQALSSGHEINLIRFQDYALQTARNFANLYPWYHMPTSLHTILMHGAEIINSALLPIGKMSEHAEESCNKYIKKYRTDFSRKCSKVKTMEDLFSQLLLASDPYISNLHKLPCKKSKSLLPEALLLLNARSISTSEGSSSYFPVESTDYESSDENTSDDDDYENFT